MRFGETFNFPINNIPKNAPFQSIFERLLKHYMNINILMCYWRMQHRIFYYQCLIICIPAYDIQLTINIFRDRDANTEATYGLLFNGTPLKRKMVMPKVISIVFMNGFYTKSLKLSKAQFFLQLIKRTDLQPQTM